MKKKGTAWTAALVLLLAPLTALAAGHEGVKSGLAAETYGTHVDEKGVIALPDGYRAAWSHLGSWVVPEKTAAGHGFHDVYAQPEAVAAFRENGRFPDGTVLIKEIRQVETEKLTTGEASWAGEVTVWFVMVKDAEGRFAESPNWGEGWGWALFEAGKPQINASSDFRQDCIPCHIPAKKNDWVYLKGYPTLK